MSEDVITKAVAALKESVGMIIGSDYDDATRAYELAETFTEFQEYLDRNGAAVVEKGAHELTGKLLEHLKDRLESRRRVHGFEKSEKETSNMDSFEKMVKDRGIVAVAKTMVDEQRAYGIDETKFTQLATEHAQRLYPNDRPDTAFAKLFSGNGPDGVVLRKAHAIAKSAGPMFDMTIVSPGDETRRTVNDTEQSEAYQALQSLADKLHAAATGMSKEQAFARAFESRPDLAAKAHRRPQATTFFPHPR
jgi:hypothetical protein